MKKKKKPVKKKEKKVIRIAQSRVKVVRKKRGRPFKKGHKKIGGIKKGTKHKKTILIKNILDLPEGAVKANLTKFMTELESLKGKQFLEVIMGLLEYLMPKLARNTMDLGEKTIDSLDALYREEKAKEK